METLAITLLFGSIIYSLLFTIVFKSIYFYEEGGFKRLQKSLEYKVSSIKQGFKPTISEYLKNLILLNKAFFK